MSKHRKLKKEVRKIIQALPDNLFRLIEKEVIDTNTDSIIIWLMKEKARREKKKALTEEIE